MKGCGLNSEKTGSSCIDRGRGEEGRILHDEIGRSAMKQRIIKRRGNRRHTQTYLAWGFSIIFLLGVTGAWMADSLPWPLPVVYGVASLVTIVAYARDKAKAQGGVWRTPENTLHALELLGGWPGALVAQWTIFHKNRKLSYQVVFWLIVFAHLAALGYYVRANGWD